MHFSARLKDETTAIEGTEVPTTSELSQRFMKISQVTLVMAGGSGLVDSLAGYAPGLRPWATPLKCECEPARQISRSNVIPLKNLGPIVRQTQTHIPKPMLCLGH